MAYAYDAGLIGRIMPRIKQYEATTGRKISQSMLDALMKGQLSAEVDKAQQTRAIDLQEEQFANQKEQQKKAAKAASIKGYVDTASTAGMGYLTYKAVTKPSPMSELIAYQKGLGAVPGTGVPSASVPAYTGASVPATTSLTAGASGIEYGTGIGAQTAIGGGTAAVGGQAALAGEAGSLAAYDAALAAGAAEGVGTAGATTGMLSAAAPYALPAVAAYAGYNLYKGLTGEDLGQDIKRTAQKVGHEIGNAVSSVGSFVRDLGSDIGDIFGW